MIADQSLFRWQALRLKFWQCSATPAILAIVSRLARGIQVTGGLLLYARFFVTIF